MDLLPKTLGTRPRLAVEIRPEGVVAARAEDAQALVSAVAFGVFEEGTVVVPGLRAGNVVMRKQMVAVLRKALEAVALKERAVDGGDAGCGGARAAAGFRCASGEAAGGVAGGAFSLEEAAAVRCG